MNRPKHNHPSPHIGDSELERISAETHIKQLEFREIISSSNDLALELIEEENTKYPLLVLAESQSSGRGRSTNQWWSAKGSLTFSLAMAANTTNLAPNHWPMASMTAGLAVCESLEKFLCKSDLRIKWPNDVFADNRKICGILVETPRLHRNNLILGIGINVNNSIETAPEEIRNKAISMCDLEDQPFSLLDVLVEVLNRLIDRISWIGLRDAELRDSWQKRCLLTNRTILVSTLNKEITGLCQGIDHEGALLLKTPSGIERSYAGTISILDKK